jgi:outer membrane protein assembly factor BamB/precorrin-6B methylase 2
LSLVFANGVLFAAGGGRLLAIQAREPEKEHPINHWPQWRGPDRRNLSPDRGLLTRWPKEGPPLLWTVQGVGEGVGTVAISDKRIYLLGHRDRDECLTALDEATGKPLWSAPLGMAVKENGVMRWLSQRTPLIDVERVFAVTALGELVCLKANSGEQLWKKDYLKDFEGRRGPFGVCDQLLLDGERLICVPGGKSATVTALNANTGEVVWKCPLGDAAGHVGAVLVGGAGVRRHYVAITSEGLVGVSTEGKLLWRHTQLGRGSFFSYTPNVLGNKLFCACNYGRGVTLLELANREDGVEVREVYHKALPTPSWQEMVVCVGEQAHVGTRTGLRCLEIRSGEMVWEEKLDSAGLRGPVTGTWADGHLYLHATNGQVALVEASPKGLVVKGTMQIPDAKAKPGSTTPVVVGGRLYLRDDDRLFCYDVTKTAASGKPAVFTVPAALTAGKSPGKPEKDRGLEAIFVPTPPDVVAKMVELAAIRKTDVVVDLGCGDGRIVVAAARKHGCRAIGYDIDPECVRMARARVKENDVEKLVTIEQKDLFTVDLSKVNVVMLYLTPGMNKRLIPQLNRLPAGARIVAHAFAIPDVPPDTVTTVKSEEDAVEHKVFVWTTPLKAPRNDRRP